MAEPSKEVVDKVRAQFPGRVVKVVTLNDPGGDEEDAVHFVMTGPNKADYKFYTEKLLAANAAKNESEKNEKMMAAVESSALAMIRWPDRETVVEMFDNRPGLSSALGMHLHKLAGTNYEVQEKK